MIVAYRASYACVAESTIHEAWYGVGVLREWET